MPAQTQDPMPSGRARTSWPCVMTPIGTGRGQHLKSNSSTMESTTRKIWAGLNAAARHKLEIRDYADAGPAARISDGGISVSEAVAQREMLAESWIPGVEIIPRRVMQQKARGYFAELARLNEGVLAHIGLAPRQWASAMMHRDSAKGFHIHAPHVPDGMAPADWFRKLYIDEAEDYSLRPYDLEQWDVMFFLTGICEIVLVDEREGMARRIMRLTIMGDDSPGTDNAAVVIPPGVAHALRSIGNRDMIMVYGTSTTFNPDWEGRIASGIENASLPADWAAYLTADSS
jgi:dTDP-4-dehydrorhamnose 3,5-epimerase-like enzyme